MVNYFYLPAVVKRIILTLGMTSRNYTGFYGFVLYTYFYVLGILSLLCFFPFFLIHDFKSP